MKPTRFPFARVAMIVLLAAVPLGEGVNLVLADAPSAAVSAPIEQRQRVFICGHSFHVFIEQPLAMLAKEAGHADHVNLGADFIGGSYPIQHWKRPDDKNLVKQALNTGNVDVLTLALNRDVPDPGVEKFAELAVAKNPGVRLMLQVSWMPWDGKDKDSFKTSEDHDRATVETLKALENGGNEYLAKLRDQVRSIDKRLGKNFVYVVPVGTALFKARNMIIAGQLPGISKQSDLFTDGMGHPKQPLKNLAAFVWFAAVYRQSPIGLESLDNPKDENSKKMNRVLQEIAWEAVTAEPLSGVMARKDAANR